MKAVHILLGSSAQRQVPTEHQGPFSRLSSLASDWTFLLGAASYGVVLVFWVCLLAFIPLSRGYPFTIISLAVIGVGLIILGTE
ncbi:hypothetical protein [Achromobacter sp. SLBN-14]|uniref:hypothetical protein n=1 Tax=Achromobacter sp. SLBN-14 TaxID=2768442 RepID=UPI001154C95B|nr:hypothetical protein [Achromobacter sp. SLBN-14]TQJ94330.1 hypothetical protein FBY20_1058 [Achromobacter sp. SLBN-14]